MHTAEEPSRKAKWIKCQVNYSSIGYLLASDTIGAETGAIEVKLGGIRAAFGLGWRF